MKKKDAIKIFGKRQLDLARALGRGNSAISQWPDDLPDDYINMVIGRAVRLGLPVPEQFIDKNK